MFESNLNKSHRLNPIVSTKNIYIRSPSPFPNQFNCDFQKLKKKKKKARILILVPIRQFCMPLHSFQREENFLQIIRGKKKSE